MPRFAHKSARSSTAGFSLVELLVAVGMLGVALSAVAAFGSTSLKLMRQNQLRLEVRHALRASGDSIVRDLRLAAACLPQNGSFVALNGVDSGTADTLTIRTGYAEDNLSCVATATNAVHGAGSLTITVDVSDGFGRALMGYIRDLDGGGEFFSIADVDPVAETITRVDPASRDYPVGSGVFAVDERIYSLDTTGPGPSRLMLERDGTGAEPFAVGISGLSVRYADFVQRSPRGSYWSGRSSSPRRSNSEAPAPWSLPGAGLLRPAPVGPVSLERGRVGV